MMDSVSEEGSEGYNEYSMEKSMDEYTLDGLMDEVEDILDAPIDEVSEDEIVDEEDLYYRNRHGYDCQKCYADREYRYVATMKPVNLTGVPKLTDIAATSVAVSLLHHENVSLYLLRINKKCAKDSDRWKKFCGKIFISSEKIPSIPNPIREMIKTKLKQTIAEIPIWISYHFRTVFLKTGKDNVLYNLIYNLVWHPSGVIDCKRTAKNMLTSHRLSDVEKLKFLSTYCLEDEILKMPSSLFAKTVVDYVNFNEYPLIFYWNCYVRNELNKIPVNENQSIECFMFQLDRVDNWPAKEYFFDRMSPAEQVQQVIWLIDKNDKVYQKMMLMKLEETQRLQVYAERAVKTMACLARAKNDEDLFSTWLEIRNLITQDDFIRIFDDLMDADIAVSVLHYIWNTAPHNVKRSFLSEKYFHIIAKVFHHQYSANNDELVFIVLKDADEKFKKSIIQQDFFFSYCKRMLLQPDQYSTFDRLMNLCIPNVPECAQFKKNFANLTSIQGVCLYHCRSADINAFSNLLNLLFGSDSDSIFKYKETLLTSENCMNPCLLIDIWSNASDNYKQYLLDYKNHEIVAYVLNSSMAADDDSHFIFTLLKDASNVIKSSIVKKPFFAEHMKDALLQGELWWFSQLLDKCSPDVEESIEFMMNLANSEAIKKLCLDYYMSANIKNVNDLLSLLFSSNANLIIEYKKTLLMAPGAIKNYGAILDSVEILNAITADIFPNPNSAYAFKKEIVFSSSAIKKFNEYIMKKQLDVAQKYIDEYLTLASDKLALKKLLLTANPEKLAIKILAKYDEKYLTTVLFWCLENERLMLEFKRSLNIDLIFNELLTGSVFETYNSLLPQCRFWPTANFTRLDQFLNWYFSSTSEIKQYKMEKIDSFKNIGMFGTLMRKKDTTFLKSILKWFFQGDVMEISKFKTKHARKNKKFCEIFDILN